MKYFLIVRDLFLQERDRWLLWTPAAVGTGIACYFALTFEPSLWWLLATPLLVTVAWLLRTRSSILVLAIGLLAFAFGFNAAQIETWSDYEPMLDRDFGPAPFGGTLMITEAMPDGVRLTLKNPEISRLDPDRTPNQIRIRMKNQNFATMPSPGTRISLFGQVGPPSEAVAPHAYDFRRQSYFMGLGGTGWAVGEVRVADANPPLSFGDKFSLAFERARRALTLHVFEHLSGDDAAMTAALLNGEQTSISKEIMQAMRVSGLSHLLSISGLHVSMMGLLVYFPLRAILALIPWVALRFPIKKYAATAAIIATIFYTILVGPQAPTLRSALSTCILMFAIIADRRAMSMRLVMLAAGLIMLMKPDGVMGPSFQMSFAAVLAMVAVFEKPLDRALADTHNFSLHVWIRHAWEYVAAIVLTSVVATAATTPFTIYHFQNFSFYGVIANMLAIPLTSFWVMPCILLAYIAAPFGLDGIFITGAGWGVHAIIALANEVATWPYALFYLPAMPACALLLIVAGSLWLCIWRRRWRFLGLLPILAGSCYPLYTQVPQILIADDGKQWAAMLDSGKLAVSNLDREKFTVTQWQQRLGMPEALDIYELAPDEKQLRCDDLGCVYRYGNNTVAFPVAEAALLEDCTRNTLVVTPVRADSCAAAYVLDDSQFWSKGAHAIYFSGDKIKIEYVRKQRGQRPWSPGYKKEQ